MVIQENWFLGFKTRIRLSIKKPHCLEFVKKKAMDMFIVYGCLDLIKETMLKLGFEDQPFRF